MTILQDIAPRSLNRVIDVVEAAGIDVSAWAASGNAANPKYCYEWAFFDVSSRVALFLLWHDGCREDETGIGARGSVRLLIHRLEAERITTARRARRFDEILQDAFFAKATIRVALVAQMDRRKATQRDGDPMHADLRELDPVVWRLVSYDYDTGAYELRRNSVANSEAAPTSAVPDVVPLLSLSSPRSDPALLIEDLQEVKARVHLPSTVREALIMARVGQGEFRHRLVIRWGGCCAVTGCSNLSVLRASHIKAWRDSSDAERMDPDNGLLLTANLDALFDAGLIAFHSDGSMWVAPSVTDQQRIDLGLCGQLRLKLTVTQIAYLEHHFAAVTLAANP